MGIRKKSKAKAKNGYVYEVSVAYKDLYGVSQRYWKSGFETKKEALEHEGYIRNEIKMNGTLYKECEKTLNEVYYEYMEYEGKQVRGYNTIVYYENTMKNHIEDSIGRMKIRFIKYKQLQDYFNDLEKNKSHPTAVNAKKVISATLQYALRCQYIYDNPLINVKLIPVNDESKEKEEKKKTITDEEFINLVNGVLSKSKYSRKGSEFNNKAYVVAMYISHYCGLRIGEAFALEKRDFDFVNETIKIDRELVYEGLRRKNYYTKGKLKSETSKATIVFPKPLQEVLKQWFEVNPHEIVICQEDGWYMSPSSFNARLSKVSHELGFHFHYHMLRHTFATTLAKNGVSDVVAMKMMRHSQISTTMQIYTHPDLEDQRKAIQKTF